MKGSQHTEWKVSWRDDHLRWVCGFANAEGEVCRERGLPAPRIDYTPGDLWIEFPYPPDYLAVIPEEGVLKTSVKTPETLLELLRRNPQMTFAEVAAEIGRSVRAVEMASAKLVKAGKLRFVEPQKGGYWEVI